jgi:small subunit ribosomal protein S20
MPNTKSAERRMRNSARKKLHNRSVKSRLRTLEKSYLALVSAGKKDEADKALKTISSALDKAAKVGVIHDRTASRKKSRLAVRLNAPAAAAPAPAAA